MAEGIYFEMTIDIKVLTSAVATLVLLIAVGYFAGRVGLLDDRTRKSLSDIVIKICQPAMIARALLGNDYSPELLKTGLFVALIGLCAHAVIALAAHLLVLRVKDADERKIFEFSLIFANCAFIGFPILEAAFGEKGLFYGSFYVVSFNIVMWSYGMLLLGRGRSDIKPSVKKMFLNYGTTPCLIGLALYVIRVPVPGFILRGAGYLSGVCTPVAALVIGGLISSLGLKKLFSDGRIYLFCLGKLIIIPILLGVCAKLCWLPAEFVYLVALMGSLSTAANTAMFAEIYGIKPTLAAGAVGMSSLLSAAAIPLVMFLVGLFA